VSGEDKPIPSETWIRIRRLCDHWAGELGFEARKLHRAIFNSALAGEFDGLVQDNKGVCFVNQARQPSYSIESSKLREFVDMDRAEQFAFEADILALHRDAVHSFAANRGWCPPSWWVPATPELHRGGGRSFVADWAAHEERLEAEIKLVGFPSKDGPPGWQTVANVALWMAAGMGDDEDPKPKTIRNQVTAMLKRIQSRIA
jgi:hypothetical protein